LISGQNSVYSFITQLKRKLRVTGETVEATTGEPGAQFIKQSFAWAGIVIGLYYMLLLFEKRSERLL
jgi:hypothetical protein